MKFFCATLLLLCCITVQAQSDHRVVKNWMAVARVNIDGHPLRRMYIRCHDGKIRYFDLMKNLQIFDGISEVRQIVSGNHDFILALKEDGTVWAWGRNENGQLGNEKLVEKKGRLFKFTDSDRPVQVTGLSGVMAIAADQSTAYALKNDGTVWAWGNARSGQTGNGKPVLHYMTTVTESYAITPGKVQGISDAIDINGPVVLLSDGTVWTWGLNNKGQLGNAGAAATSVPRKVKDIKDASSVSSNVHGTRHALKEDGTLWAWGSNLHGNLGIGKYEILNDFRYAEIPQMVSVVKNGVLVVGGINTHLLLLKNGTVWGWGDGRSGALGIRAEDVVAPVKIPVLKNAIGIYAGTANGFALLDDGSIWAWGDGFGGADKNPTPIKIADLGNNHPL